MVALRAILRVGLGKSAPYPPRPPSPARKEYPPGDDDAGAEGGGSRAVYVSVLRATVRAGDGTGESISVSRPGERSATEWGKRGTRRGSVRTRHEPRPAVLTFARASAPESYVWRQAIRYSSTRHGAKERKVQHAASATGKADLLAPPQRSPPASLDPLRARRRRLTRPPCPQ